MRAPFAVLAVILILYPILFASFRLERYFGFKGSRGRDVRIARGILGAFLLVCTLIIMVPTFSNIEDVFGSVAEQNRMKFAFVFCFVAMMFTIPDALLVERDLKLKGK
ncbi:TPA: hypothetical protein EYP38_02895 [Candidatus Micrarchaeota archaeon]|nr:hypothetical protein [Candidatus Micrarchaeota archaeon]